MRLISWNVGGFQAKYEKGGIGKVFDLNPDIFCLQEVRKNPKNLDSKMICQDDYYSYFYPPQKPELNGFSGVATYTKYAPISLRHGFGNKFDIEGRIQTIEFEEFVLYNVYFPTGENSRKAKETNDKYEFYELFTEYVNESVKPQIICGDFNRGASKLDIYNYNSSTNGFRKEELEWFEELLESGFVDTFRYINKDSRRYTWWHKDDKNREKNEGMRLDYFIVNEELKDNITNATVLSDIYYGDHAPISLELDL